MNRALGCGGMTMKWLILSTAMIAAGALAQAADVAPRNGDYLSETYLAALEKTKSHYRAWKATQDKDGPQAIVVTHDKRGLVLSLIYNWHEGDEAVYDGAAPSRQIDRNNDHVKTLMPIDATYFKFKDQYGIPLAYRYIGDEQTYLMSKTLAGTYSNAQGRRYTFTSDGKAQFPDRTFHYEIYTDMVFEDCDQYVDRDASKPNNWKTFGFEHKGGRMYLYNLDCENQAGCTADRKHPIAVLKRIGSAK